MSKTEVPGPLISEYAGPVISEINGPITESVFVGHWAKCVSGILLETCFQNGGQRAKGWMRIRRSLDHNGRIIRKSLGQKFNSRQQRKPYL